MPSHIVFMGAMVGSAVALGGIAAVGYLIYKEMQEQEQYQGSFYSQQSRQDSFQHVNDFDFEHDSTSDDEKSEQLRNRKPYTAELDDSSVIRKSLEKDQYELEQLENSISERKRRLLAEQAFLDKQEELLRNRQNKLIHSERLLNEISSSEDCESEDPFEQNASFFESQENSESHNSAVFQDATESQDNSEPQDDSPTLIEPNTVSSLELRLPNASLVVSTPSYPNSDSEESWDAVSDDDWNRTKRSNSVHSLSDNMSYSSFTDDEAHL